MRGKFLVNFLRSNGCEILSTVWVGWATSLCKGLRCAMNKYDLQHNNMMYSEEQGKPVLFPSRYRGVFVLVQWLADLWNPLWGSMFPYLAMDRACRSGSYTDKDFINGACEHESVLIQLVCEESELGENSLITPISTPAHYLEVIVSPSETLKKNRVLHHCRH